MRTQIRTTQLAPAPNVAPAPKTPPAQADIKKSSPKKPAVATPTVTSPNAFEAVEIKETP